MRVILICLILAFVCEERLFSQSLHLMDRPVQKERVRHYDALHYKIQLEFDLEEKTFEGSNQISLVPLGDQFSSCSFDIAELIIQKVTNPDNSPLVFTSTESSVDVDLGKNYSRSDTVKLIIHYRGHDPSDGILFDDETEEWPQMVSSNSWPINARYWFPCYDYPNDKVVQETIITANEDLKVLSNGKLVDIKHDKQAKKKTWHWYQSKPHSTYLSMLAIGPFVVIEDSLGDLPINYWVYEQDEEVAREVFAITPKAIEFFNELYDYEYPWDKYDQVIGPHQGGGAEATSATILGLGAVRHKRPDQDDNWDRIIAHEIAHQWWGDLITLKSWEHTWMNESFGTYSDHLYTAAFKGPKKGALDLERKKNQYLREASEKYKRPIVFNRYNRPHDNFDSHTYPKGAIVLHMLRYQIGDETFFKILSEFLHRFEFQAVETKDFTELVKENSGKDMDWFFDQFLFKPGHPEFDISYDYSPCERHITLFVKQVQDTSIGTPIYKLPVEIGITTEMGTEVYEIWIDKKEQSFKLPSEEKPLMVRFDENNWLLKEWTFKKTKEELEFQSKYDDIIGRNWAKAQLLKMKDERRKMKDQGLPPPCLRGTKGDIERKNLR